MIAELGAGSLSTVYHAVEEPLEREVAIKALKNTISTSSSFAAQLLREARLLSELCHPSIAMLHELVQTESELYLVLEYVAGPNLAELLARKPKLPPEAAAIIGAAVARGLEHAHDRLSSTREQGVVVTRDVERDAQGTSPTGHSKFYRHSISK